MQTGGKDLSQSPLTKKARIAQLASRLKPSFHFKELDIEKSEWSERSEEKFSAHADSRHNLFVSDTRTIVCFRPDGSFRIVVCDIEPHHIVPNGTADQIVILRKNDKQRLCRVFPDDGRVETILESTAPLYGPDVCSNGDVVHHPSTSRLERRRSKTGELAACIDGGRGRVISFEANSYLTSGQDDQIYFSSKTCIYRWSHQERSVECIAGHPKSAGKRDGFGSDARFTHLKRPVLAGAFAYVRENDNRFCRISLSTFEVVTIQMVGIDADRIETYGITPDGRMMFVIQTSPFRIYTADTTDILASTFDEDMRRIDWTGSSGARVGVEFCVGPSKHIVKADGRILEARSTYFRSMLSGGMREAVRDTPINLGEEVSPEALHALLHFLHTDHFEPVSPPSNIRSMSDEEALKNARFALDVHTLADRFLLPRLVRICEVFLAEFVLRPTLVLPILAQITAPTPRILATAALEAACWDYLEEHWKLVQSQEDAIRTLVEQRHPLAFELIRSASGVTRRRGGGSGGGSGGDEAEECLCVEG